MPRPLLTHEQILEWADAFYARVGRWPTRLDGRRCVPESNWSAIDQCLKCGFRGLSKGSSLAKLLLDRRQRRHKGLLPRLTTTQVLAWADAHHAATGDWPTQSSGRVADDPNESWDAIDMALIAGHRGLAGGSSLAQLLLAERGVGHHLALPRLTPAQILGWADAHHQRTGDWPNRNSGQVAAAGADESWGALDSALKKGLRGLEGGSSLARLLEAERGVRNVGALPRLERWEILSWADAFHERTGEWPTHLSGAIPESAGETWLAVQSALTAGSRGWPGKDSLANLLARHRGKRNPAALPSLTEARILEWADAHHERTGKWPGKDSGPIAAASGESWLTVNKALMRGRRGLAGGSTLAKLLQEQRGVRNKQALPRLTPAIILVWADAHRASRGDWPTTLSGPVATASGETWANVNAALVVGNRGLPGGSSLAQLLAQERGVRNHLALPPLTAAQILAWAQAHQTRTGQWPRVKSGAIVDAPGENWASIDTALRDGGRGLPGGSSLFQLVSNSGAIAGI